MSNVWGIQLLIMHLIGVVVWRGYLHSARKIENDLVDTNISLAPCGHHGIANLHGKFGFCLRECFWAVFVPEVCSMLCGVFVRQLSNQLGVSNRQVQGLLLGIAEHDIPKAG